MPDQFYRLKVSGRILDALYSSSNEAVAQAMLIFGTADPDVAVLAPGGEIVWASPAARASQTCHAPLAGNKTGAMPGPLYESAGG
jgi:hypothetical protein